MGAWDASPFGNDAALDYLHDVEDAADAADPLQGALEVAVEQEDYLEAPAGEEAVAAAAVLALANGATLPDPGETEAPLASPLDDIVDRVATMGLDGADVTRLAPLALRALTRVLEPGTSELHDLWEDEDATDWRRHVEAVRAGLRPRV